MWSFNQLTIDRPVRVDGVALHSGVNTRVVLQPAPADHGIVFRRTDLPGAPRIPARVQKVGKARLATRLQVDGAAVVTVEHLLAALSSLGIHHVEIQVHGPELPILDGSSLPWLRLLDSAGRRDLGVPQPVLRLSRPVSVRDGRRWMRAAPATGLLLDVTLDFAETAIGSQRVVWRHAMGRFRSELAWARTFAFLRDVNLMRSRSLALGGGLDNALVFTGTGVLDPAAQVTPDEPARHKALDLLGDLTLLGAPLHARVTAVRPGHALTAALMRDLVDAIEWAHPDTLGHPPRSATVPALGACPPAEIQ